MGFTKEHNCPDMEQIFLFLTIVSELVNLLKEYLKFLLFFIDCPNCHLIMLLSHFSRVQLCATP